MVNVVMTALVYLLTMVMSYILKRAGLFHKEDKKVLSNLIFYITLPASLISSFAGAEVNVYYVIAILLGFLVNTVMVISGQIVSADKSPELKEYIRLMLRDLIWPVLQFHSYQPFIQQVCLIYVCLMSEILFIHWEQPMQ